jgi:pimeloyl-ACP methyl ester carboxylesterase
LPSAPRRAPPVLFLHGSWHGAWCWAENFLDYFAANGFAAYALSFRGHCESEGCERLRWTRIRDFVADVAAVVDMLPSPPILIGHSMGGFVAQKYLEGRSLPGMVLVASAPPRGLLRSLFRLMRREPLAVLKSAAALSLWPIVADADRARALFFSPSMPREQASRYCARLQDDSYLAYLDCLALDLVDVQKISTPALVTGASLDAVIQPDLVAATARAYGVEPVMFETMAHDMMLELDWRKLADAILAWVETLEAVAPQSTPLRRVSADNDAQYVRRMNMAS